MPAPDADVGKQEDVGGPAGLESSTSAPSVPPAFAIDTSPLRDAAAIAARDREWLRRVHRPNEAQLTVRAAATGMVLGGILSASNLYIGLKIGWSFGMGITSAVLGFAIFAALRAVFPRMLPLTVLENNTSQTAASAAAYMSSAGLVSSFPALVMLQREGIVTIPELTSVRLVLYLLGISLLGVVVAVPLKRNMINAEQLRFPNGIACAETIRTMHEDGAPQSANGKRGQDSLAKARSLLYAASIAAVMKLVFDCKISFLKKLPELIAFPGKIRGLAMSAWSLGVNTSLLLYALGAILGLRVTSSLLLGAIVNYAIIGPGLLDHDVLRVASTTIASDPAQWSAFDLAAKAAHAIAVASPAALHGAIRAKWSVWPGTAMMVSASLVAFAFRWRTISRAFAGLGTVFSKEKPAADPLASVEVPTSWFTAGLAVTASACVWMQWAWFSVPILEGIVSVALAFVLSIVAARATGETGVTPIGAMGKITQLLFGVLVPGNAAANLMTATVTAGSTCHSADLLNEVKTGYLLGASPRKQFVAQILGVFAGAAVCVPVYALIAKPEKIGNELAAPAAVAWASVARLLKDGVHNLPAYALHAIVLAAVVGAVLAVLDEVAPKRAKPFVPSASGIGIAMVIDANDSLAMFIGAVLVYVLLRARKDLADRYTVSVASGAIAGEGLMGIIVIFLRDVAHVLPR
jgi:OPT family oligopeptide transporter